MTLPQADIDGMLDPLIARVTAARKRGSLERTSADFWAARASEQFPCRAGTGDRGLISIYLLNLVRLAPGEGTFIPGPACSIPISRDRHRDHRRNSDNVLRGGLTVKHVDVPELLGTLTFESGRPELLQKQPGVGRRARLPDAGAGVHAQSPGPGRGTAVRDPSGRRCRRAAGRRGEATVEGAAIRWRFGRGGIVLVPNGQACTIRTDSRAVVFRASVPSRRQDTR